MTTGTAATAGCRIGTRCHADGRCHGHERMPLPGHRKGQARDMARTLRTTATGIKHDVSTRDEFVARMTVAVDLFPPALDRG